MTARARASLVLGLALCLAGVLGLGFPELGRAEPAARPAHRASVTEGLDCSACHTPDGWKSVSAGSGSSGFDHSRTGFPLTQRHVNVPCAGCHRSDRPITRQCSGCHQDAHAGQLGAGCDGCHSAAGWYQTAAFARHRQTRLPLTGMHALVECRECHQRTTDRTWTTTAADCFACHAADYQRPDIHPLHVGVAGDPAQPPFPRDCSQCHRASGWLPAFVPGGLVSGGLALTSAQAHDRFFPLSHGPHRAADCASCHTSRSAPQAVRCTGCHAHDEVKLREQHRQVAAFGSSCLGCHPGGRAR
jgi:Class III cytochrome C family